jgi:hypothetical protein
VLEAQEAATAGMTRNRSEATGVRSNLRIGAHKLYGFEGAWLAQVWGFSTFDNTVCLVGLSFWEPHINESKGIRRHEANRGVGVLVSRHGGVMGGIGRCVRVSANVPCALSCSGVSPVRHKTRSPRVLDPLPPVAGLSAASLIRAATPHVGSPDSSYGRLPPPSRQVCCVNVELTLHRGH